ncbi:hypothetical protein [Paenibacillus sp. P32E]|uniref:hypothetical protein n=1 Tax=Paenibacillus sp. P32E TaxID=1349434 RepID=UPI00093A3A03|nr:hypothetical protein [Paenibacillus sp. P32E]
MEWNYKKLERPIHFVYQVIERTMEADGQLLLVTRIEVQVFFTTLTCSVINETFQLYGLIQLKTDRVHLYTLRGEFMKYGFIISFHGFR